jgi:thioredoxin-related protein
VQCKRLFQRLKIRSTPAFIFFRGGEVVGQSSGANKERLEAAVRSYLTPAELAGKEPLYGEPVPAGGA